MAKAKRLRLHKNHTWLKARGKRASGAAVNICSMTKGLRIPYHNKADGFMAALVLTLNQFKFCEFHGCQPHVDWGPFPACKYAGVRFPGRTPFHDAARGRNAFEYYFRPVCESHAPAQEVSPALSCEQREKVHRVLPWAVRTYHYGAGSSAGVRPTAANDTFDEPWYAAQRAEGARLVRSYLRLQAHVTERLAGLEAELLGGGLSNSIGSSGSSSSSSSGGGGGSGDAGDAGAGELPQAPRRGPVLGVHLRGTDKGKYMNSAGSGRPIGPAEYEPYVRAFLAYHGANASVFLATDSPSYLDDVVRRWPSGRVRYRHDVLRHEGNVAFAGATATKGASYRKGEEVLLDALLLSRCDFLLHAASGVAEAAIYWRPALHKQSVHLQYSRGRTQPDWLGAAAER